MSTRFDAAADQLTRTTNLPPIATFTMMGWFLVKAAPAASGAFLSFGTAAGSIYYELLVSSTLVLGIWNGTANGTGATLVLNKWYHLALAVAGTGASQCVGYLNGKANITLAGNAPNTAGLISVGTSVDLVDDLNGRAAAVKIWDRALTAQQVLAEVWSAHPVNWYKLNSYHLMRTAPLSRVDDNGRGRHLTVGGTLTTEADPPGVVWMPPLARRKAVRKPATAGGAVKAPYYYRHLAGAA